VLLGVDGGNTKTIALVAREDGTIVGIGRAGRADIYNAPTPEAAIDEIVQAASDAIAAAGGAGADVEAAAFSLAGADWDEDFALLEDVLPARLGLRGKTLVVNDAIGAIRCGSDDGIGVAVVCGTHGVAGGRGRDGRVFHLGFWPDASGADALGRRALRAIWRAMIGTGPVTALEPAALACYGASDARDLLHRFTGRGLPEVSYATLARAVLDTAEAGDAVAHEIVLADGHVLGDQARACAEQVGLSGSPYQLVLAGGVLRHPSPLLVNALTSRVPDALVTRSRHEPAVGALLMAFDATALEPDPDRLEASIPDGSFYATVDRG
jgi:N-acetylglucosamine kinase-like BadF-type ATPase